MSKNDEDKKHNDIDHPQPTDEQNRKNDNENNDEKRNENNSENNNKSPDIDLEALMKELEKLEKTQGQSKQPKQSRMITIEFGGAFHSNLLVNTIFYFILNLAILSVLFELTGFAEYDSSLFVIMFVAAYTILELMFRIYMMTKHIRLVFKTFGLIFYLGYLFIFYILDSFVFERYLYFLNETLLVVFVAIFAIVRYIISFYIRQNFRNRNLR